MKISTKIFIYISLVFSSLQLNAADIPFEKMDSIALKEIVVQASRNETNLKSISNSVALLSASQIENLGLNSLTDATGTIANLFMPDYGSKLTSPIYIRGIGSRINAPSVGLYVDNVPYFEKAAFNFDFFDINRLEVLRGPQGTEYGRNTMGGIVNILTKSPLNYQGTDLNLQAATFGSYLVNAGHYAKPTDKFAWSLALNYRHNDGFFSNKFSNKKVDVLDSYGLRNRLIATVSDRFSIENILSLENSKQGGYPYAVYFAANDSVSDINYNQKSGYNRQLLSDALLFKFKSKLMDITATTAYQYLSDKQYIDQDFSKDSLFFVVQNQKQNMLSQEFLFQSKKNRKYNWLFGAYGFMQQFYNDVNVSVYSKKTETLKTYDHTITGAALFHQSVLNNFPFKNMTVTAGVRLDTEKDKLGYNLLATKAAATTAKLDTSYQALNSLMVLPKLTVNYKLEHTNIYVLIAKGYKTGGFNSTFERPEDITFNPEYSWNYEIGAKSSLIDDKVFVSAALFYIDWKNQQISQSSPSGIGTMLKNAGRSESKGFELELNTASFSGWELTASYGLTNARFVDNQLNSMVNYSGNYIPYVPKHTVATQLRKTIEIKNSYLLNKLIFSALYKGVGTVYWNEANSSKQDFYGIVDGRISFIRKNIQLDIWGSNLSSTSYKAYYFETGGKKYVQTGKPMQLGVKLALKF